MLDGQNLNSNKKTDKNKQNRGQLFSHLKSFEVRFGQKKKRLKEKRSYLVNLSVKKLLVLKNEVCFLRRNEGNSQHWFSVFWKVGCSSSAFSTGPRSYATSKFFFSQKSLGPKDSFEYFCFLNRTSLRPPRRFFPYIHHKIMGKLIKHY